jgi:hypothetical protein
VMHSISYVHETKNPRLSTFEDLRIEDPKTRYFVWNVCDSGGIFGAED